MTKSTRKKTPQPAPASRRPLSDADRHVDRRGRTMHSIWNPPRPERAVLVGHAGRDGGDLERSLAELALLADTAGAKVEDTVVQRRGRVHPASFIGKGKIDELKGTVDRTDADVAIFNDDLSPPQVRNLEKALERKVVDRSELILDIFARRARTRESRLQVELAQLQYQMPRLTGMWKHLERQAGGIGTRGPGETQLEVDRRRVRERIATLRRQLEAVERERETQRRRRRSEFRVAIVGYTNAGKSTLFNALTRSHVFVENRLFATLDATTRQMVSPERTVALLTDTVGFIRKLPHHLVASFHSTLIEAIEADLLLHVVDASDPDVERQVEAVDAVLEQLLETPRPTRMVYNKCDLLTDPDAAPGLRARQPGAFVVSARTGEGLDALRRAVWDEVESSNGRGEQARGDGAGSVRDADSERTQAEGPGDPANGPASEARRLRFDRVLPPSPDRVFAALTDARHLRGWFCDDAASEPGEGGALMLRWIGPGASAEPFVGRWTLFDSPFECAYEGGHAGYPEGHAGRIHFDLTIVPGGTRLVVEHLMPADRRYAPHEANYRKAWPRALAKLEAYLTPKS